MKTKKKKVCETFKKDGKIIETCGTMEEKIVSKNQVKQENKILRNLLITFAFIMVVVFVSYIVSLSFKNFEYNGMQFNKVKEGKIRFYHTTFPVLQNGEKLPYNIYIRNDPRRLEGIPFNGEINLTFPTHVVINQEKDFNCDGDGIIGIANLINIYQALGAKVISDENAVCDERYVLIDVKQGDSTQINQKGLNCYDILVNNCEILKVTERFIIEELEQINYFLE
jgi:hypothetical protein